MESRNFLVRVALIFFSAGAFASGSGAVLTLDPSGEKIIFFSPGALASGSGPVLTIDPSVKNLILVPQEIASATPLARAEFKAANGSGRLVVEFVEDGMARLEYSANPALPGNSEPLFASPM